MADQPKEGKPKQLTESMHRQGINFLKNVTQNKGLSDAVRSSQDLIAKHISDEIRGRE